MLHQVFLIYTPERILLGRRAAMATKDILEPSLEVLGIKPYKIKKQKNI